MRILLLILASAHIFYNKLIIEVRLLQVAETKGAENPIYLIMLIKSNFLTIGDQFCSKINFQKEKELIIAILQNLPLY